MRMQLVPQADREDLKNSSNVFSFLECFSKSTTFSVHLFNFQYFFMLFRSIIKHKLAWSSCAWNIFPKALAHDQLNFRIIDISPQAHRGSNFLNENILVWTRTLLDASPTFFVLMWRTGDQRRSPETLLPGKQQGSIDHRLPSVKYGGQPESAMLSYVRD